jgi:hypothetical protein
MNAESIASVVFLNETEAAKVFKMGTTSFKAKCRCIGIKKWPYRRLTTLNKLYNDLKLDGREHAAMMHEINDFVAMIKKDFSLATGPWPDNILNIRRKIYKKRHKKTVADRVTTMEACKVDEEMHFMGLDAFPEQDLDLPYDFSVAYNLFSGL